MINLKILFKNTTKYSKNIYEEFLKFHGEKFKLSYTLYTATLISLSFLLVLWKFFLSLFIKNAGTNLKKSNNLQINV